MTKFMDVFPLPAFKGSQNVGGIADPVIDALIDKVIIDQVIAAESRPALIAEALDRIIRSGRHWVLHWYNVSHWLAYWHVSVA